MKRLFIFFSLFIGLAVSQPVLAYKEADLKKLLDTKSCQRCDLRGANLKDELLVTADLRGANLSNADLEGAWLNRANLTGADLTNADLRWANLSGAKLTAVNLIEANLTDVNLTVASLTGANLTGANLTGAKLKWANLTGANLSGVSLRYVILTGADMDRVEYCNTTMPNGTVNNSGCTAATTPTTPKPEEQPTPTPTPTPDSPSLRLAGTGTAFVVSKNYLLTASHVIDECKEVSIRHSHEETDVAIAAWDETNDVGLLKSEKSFQHIAKFRGGKPIRLGDTVVNYGYPLFGELSDHAKISKGEINSLAGIANDSSVFQYDAATQPGNSGGPVLDLSGNVVGIVSSGLSKKYADATGHIAQNVNFAVKSYVAEGFLSANGVNPERAESVEELRTADIAEKAERFTVLVGCWQ